MSKLARLRWGWILVGGVVAEIALMLFVPIQFLPGGDTALLYLVVPLCVIVTGLFGGWAADRRSRSITTRAGEADPT